MPCIDGKISGSETDEERESMGGTKKTVIILPPLSAFGPSPARRKRHEKPI